MVYPALLPLMRTPRLRSSRLNWRACRFKWTRPFRRKKKSGFCACAITFQTQSTYFRISLYWVLHLLSSSRWGVCKKWWAVLSMWSCLVQLCCLFWCSFSVLCPHKCNFCINISQFYYAKFLATYKKMDLRENSQETAAI